jgi:hypothetical protein
MKGIIDSARFVAVLAAALCASVVLAGEARAQEYRYTVRQDLAIGARDGELVITTEGVRYRSEDGEHGGTWAYRDIRLFEILSPTRVRIHTYEDIPRLLGKDKTFTLEIVRAELTREVSEFLRGRIARPFVTAFADEEGPPVAEVAVKHNHRLGGCQGVLRIYKGRLVFAARDGDHSRSWRWTDLRGLGRADQYRLEVVTYEPQFGGQGRSYTFALKEPLADETFDLMWTSVYRPAPLGRAGATDVTTGLPSRASEVGGAGLP